METITQSFLRELNTKTEMHFDDGLIELFGEIFPDGVEITEAGLRELEADLPVVLEKVAIHLPKDARRTYKRIEMPAWTKYRRAAIRALIDALRSIE